MSKIKELCIKKGITQKELAQRSGVGVWTLSNYSNGKVDMTLKVAKKVADVLGVKVDDLMN